MDRYEHNGTWIEPEEMAYPHGGQTRKFSAYLGDTSYRVSGKAGIPDTFFSIPANARIKGAYVAGFLMLGRDLASPNEYDTSVLRFHPYKKGN